MPYRIPSVSDINDFAGSNGLNVISTFSGCGGSSFGYKLAGCRVPVACEFIPEAVETYKANSPSTVVVSEDIRQVSGSDLLGRAGLLAGELDILDGSPPCSAFSMAGLRDKGWGIEKQYSGNTSQRVDDLFFEFTRLVDEIQPKVVVAENVAGLTVGDAKGYFKEIWSALESAGPGYVVNAAEIDSDRLGVPQKRKRLIFICVRQDITKKARYPQPLNTHVPVAAAIKDLPEPFPKWEDIDATPTDQREYDILRPGTRTRQAWDYTDVMKSKGCFRDAYLRLFNKDARYMWFRVPPNHPSPTITAKIPCLFRWDVPRTFSIPEIKRLSSFPDDFIVTGNFKQKWERIGRAVPPMMMGAIANQIVKEIFGYGGKTLVDQFYEDLSV